MKLQMTSLSAGDRSSWHTAVSNAGRWGVDDELGTLNYITRAKVRSALAAITRGAHVSIGHDIPTADPTVMPPQAMHAMLYRAVDSITAQDLLVIRPHGFNVTHLDAIAHEFLDGQTYNGRLASEVVTETGLTYGAITAARDGIITRGVFLDVAATLGIECFAAGSPVSAADLDAAVAHAAVEIEPGDAVFVRVGTQRLIELGGPLSTVVRAGLDISTLEWFHRNQVSLFGGDCIDQLPSGMTDLPNPLHQIGQALMGLMLLDWPDVEALKLACERYRTNSFALFVSPLRIPGGTGSAVNPIAVF